MDVNAPFLQPFPNFLRGVPGARHVREDEPSQRPGGVSPQGKGGQTENAAQDGSDQLRFPMIDFLDMLEKFDITLYYPGPRDVIPTPEFWGGGTGDASDSGFAAVVLDGDAATLPIWQRLSATLAFAQAGQQITTAVSLS